MGQNSKIEWTHHTFNPWRGCTKVSDGCKHCYAEANLSVKFHGVTWGKQGSRLLKAESGWSEPLKWDRDAAAAGERHRVFCASLADVFEGPETMPAEAWTEVRAARLRLFQLIQRTPHLDWLLLTKRPQNVMPLIEQSAMYSQPGDTCEMLNLWLKGNPPDNVWLGTSIEDQKTADERSAHLRHCPAAVRFYSAEPLLGPIDRLPLDGISWLIVGGESGPHARPMHPDWARSLRDQCPWGPVAFHFKQWGEWLPYDIDAQRPFWSSAADGHVIDGHIFPDSLSDGNPVDGWLANLEPDENMVVYRRVGKAAAGRLLDGRMWDEFPQVAQTGGSPCRPS